eukprot:8507823-Pyramimonas_sp.AAC.1
MKARTSYESSYTFLHCRPFSQSSHLWRTLRLANPLALHCANRHANSHANGHSAKVIMTGKHTSAGRRTVTCTHTLEGNYFKDSPTH